MASVLLKKISVLCVMCMAGLVLSSCGAPRKPSQAFIEKYYAPEEENLEAKKFQPRPGMARVYIASSANIGGTYTAWLGNRNIGQLRNRFYLVEEVAPGNIRVSVTHGSPGLYYSKNKDGSWNFGVGFKNEYYHELELKPDSVTVLHFDWSSFSGRYSFDKMEPDAGKSLILEKQLQKKHIDSVAVTHISSLITGDSIGKVLAAVKERSIDYYPVEFIPVEKAKNQQSKNSEQEKNFALKLVTENDIFSIANTEKSFCQNSRNGDLYVNLVNTSISVLFKDCKFSKFLSTGGVPKRIYGMRKNEKTEGIMRDRLKRGNCKFYKKSEDEVVDYFIKQPGKKLNGICDYTDAQVGFDFDMNLIIQEK